MRHGHGAGLREYEERVGAALARPTLLYETSCPLSGLAADESLISLDRASHLVDAALVLRKADTVEHEPRGSLSSR